MCDCGWDGDMWNPNTPSGKPINSRPYYTSDGKKCWETEGERIDRVLPKSLVKKTKSKLRRILDILFEK